jgi:hypothetical protein
MAFFPRNKTNELKAEISRLQRALDEQGQRTAKVETTLSERVLPTLPLPGAEPAEPSPAAPAEPSIDPAEVERALAMAADVGTRLDAVTKQLTDLDARLTSVSRELANQLSELGGDIDALASRPDGAGVDEEVLEELRDAQLRLANEQARYQIAFRSDLARLAEQVRRPASR